MLVNNIEICRKYLRIAKNVTFDQLRQHMEDFELIQISHLFGLTFYSTINARYNNGVPNPALTEQEQHLITLLQGGIVRLAFVKAIPSLISSFEGSGFYQASSSNSKPLYEWQKLDIENVYLEDGWNAIGAAQRYLFSNRDTTAFATWKNSEAEKKTRALFITSAAKFSDYVEIGSSQRTFEALKSIIKEVELLRIKPILGDELFNSLKTNLLTAEPNGKHEIAINYINHATANLSLASALVKLEFKMDEEGARVVSVSATSAGKAKVKTPGEDMRKLQTIEACKQSAQEFMADLRTYLNQNPTDFGGYVVPVNEELSNEDSNTFFL